ncbi:MAG: NIL domain-containing protein [Lachnospiraceae bacterium]|nr:NIL domain-containing protein [Lachnospiraceae bacterium]
MILSGGGIQALALPQRCLRIAFDGFSSSVPLISQLTFYTGEMINILGANTEDIGGKAYGQIVIELPQNAETLYKIESFLDERGIHYEEGGGVA